MNKSETQKYVQGLQKENEELNEQVGKLKKAVAKQSALVDELESELFSKENLLKTKNGLCGEEIPKEVTVDGFKCEIIQTEQGIYIDRDRIYGIIEREKEPIKKKCAELENRHQSDCITINQLHTALDVMTEKYQKLREMRGL